MKILVLGGTRFVGRHIVAACLARNDDVTILYRGHSPSPFVGIVRHVLANRRAPTAEASRVLAEPWDAVIDTSAQDVDDLAPITPVFTDVGRYLFVSTCAVYQPTTIRPALTERSPTVRTNITHPVWASASRKLRGERHLRRWCERAAVPWLIARLGLVVGTYDYSKRLAYWLERTLRGGELLVPMQPTQPIQLIDATDVATFLRNAVDRRLTGVVNVAGPPSTAHDLLEELLARAGQPCEPRWVNEDYVLANGVRPWTEIPLWLPTSNPQRALLAIDSNRARETGLTYRPVTETLTACMAWQTVRQDWSQRWLDPAREQQLLHRWQG